MNQLIKRILFSVIAVTFLLTACAPASAPAAATQDPALVQKLIEQSVALTVAAQNAQTQQAQALIPAATNTPLPTQTEVAPPAPSLPTATPFVIVPPTVAPVTSGGGAVPTQKPLYACDIIRRRPFDNTVYRPKEDFDIRWTIINTGTRSLRKGLDVKYYSGPQMSTTAFVEMPELKPGDQFEFILDAKAPDTVGFHVMTWAVEGNLCYPYVAIIVEK